MNGSDLVRDLVGGLGADVVVTGGLAGDGDRFEGTWVIDDGELRAGRAVAVGFYGESLEVGYGSQGGWGIFGPERTVTRSEGNVLYELDGKPAFAVYRRYLGDLASGLPATALLFPLAVRSEHDSEQLVRSVLAVDEDAQTMTFAGDVPQGSRAQLMRASPGRLVDGAATAAGLSAPTGTNGGPTLGIVISCVGRRLVLGERTEEEIEATLESLPERSELVGFYSYGGDRAWCRRLLRPPQPNHDGDHPCRTLTRLAAPTAGPSRASSNGKHGASESAVPRRRTPPHGRRSPMR